MNCIICLILSVITIKLKWWSDLFFVVSVFECQCLGLHLGILDLMGYGGCKPVLYYELCHYINLFLVPEHIFYLRSEQFYSDIPDFWNHAKSSHSVWVKVFCFCFTQFYYQSCGGFQFQVFCIVFHLHIVVPFICLGCLAYLEAHFCILHFIVKDLITMNIDVEGIWYV